MNTFFQRVTWKTLLVAAVALVLFTIVITITQGDTTIKIALPDNAQVAMEQLGIAEAQTPPEPPDDGEWKTYHTRQDVCEGVTTLGIRTPSWAVLQALEETGGVVHVATATSGIHFMLASEEVVRWGVLHAGKYLVGQIPVDQFRNLTGDVYTQFKTTLRQNGGKYLEGNTKAAGSYLNQIREKMGLNPC